MPHLTMDSMRATVGRVIRPELLDNANGPDKQASLRDLVRIGRYLGGHHVLRRLVRRVTAPAEAFTMLDVGGASGDAARLILRDRPNAVVTSFDYRLEHLAPAPYPKTAGDAFRLPFRDRSFDFVFCSLFLHHFEDDAVVELLRAFGTLARRVAGREIQQ